MNLHPVEEQMIVLDAPASLRGSHSLTGIHVKEWISMSVKTAIIPICGCFYSYQMKVHWRIFLLPFVSEKAISLGERVCNPLRLGSDHPILYLRITNPHSQLVPTRNLL